MIHPDSLERFQQEAEQYKQYKEKVKKYVFDRYESSSKRPISVYSICVGFQMVIANIPQGALTVWLEEWGYKVEYGAQGSTDNLNHLVNLKQKSLFTHQERLENRNNLLIGDMPNYEAKLQKPKKNRAFY